MTQGKQTENKQTNGFMESMKLFQKVYDFLVYIFPILGQLPKFEKFALQLYIKQSLFELVKDIIRFRKDGNEKPYICGGRGTGIYTGADSACV